MKIVNAGFQRILEPSLTKKIERIARICYKSEDRIGEGTDVKMIQALMNREHFAMLEHGDVCIEVSEAVYDHIEVALDVIQHNIAETNGSCYTTKKMFLRRTSTCLIDDTMRYVISGNIRAWFEFFTYAAAMGAVIKQVYDVVNAQIAHLLDTTMLAAMDLEVDYEEWELNKDDVWVKLITDLTQLTNEERMIHETISILFTTDRGVTHELVRMRDCSFAQESTRYCNYANEKFGTEITVIEPWFFAKSISDKESENYSIWKESMEFAEARYVELIANGATPQQARSVLPHSVKAEIVMTANLFEWHHIMALRACDITGPSHPQMHEIMQPLLLELRPEYPFAFGNLMIPGEK